MATVSLPYRPTNLTPEDISQIIANFDAVLAQLNGQIDDTNIKAAKVILLARLATGGAVTDDGLAFNGTDWGPAKMAHLLQQVQYNPTSVASPTTTANPTTLADLDATNLILPAITVPANGKLMFMMCAMTQAAGQTNLFWGVREGTNFVGSAKVSPQASGVPQKITMWLTVTGLTPGQSKQYKFAQGSITGTVGTTYGTQASPAAADPGPANFAVWSIP